jgi:hypothetical protein
MLARTLYRLPVIKYLHTGTNVGVSSYDIFQKWPCKYGYYSILRNLPFAYPASHPPRAPWLGETPRYMDRPEFRLGLKKRYIDVLLREYNLTFRMFHCSPVEKGDYDPWYQFVGIQDVTPRCHDERASLGKTPYLPSKPIKHECLRDVTLIVQSYSLHPGGQRLWCSYISYGLWTNGVNVYGQVVFQYGWPVLKHSCSKFQWGLAV